MTEQKYGEQQWTGASWKGTEDWKDGKWPREEAQQTTGWKPTGNVGTDYRSPAQSKRNDK
jgi:hypothetical protein